MSGSCNFFWASGEVPASAPYCDFTSACWIVGADCQRIVSSVSGTPPPPPPPPASAPPPPPPPPRPPPLPPPPPTSPPGSTESPWGPLRLPRPPPPPAAGPPPPPPGVRVTETFLAQGESVMIFARSLSFQ